MAAQVPLATTATPRGISTTSTTPGTARAGVASKDFTLPPKAGGCVTTAVSMPGSCTSMVKVCVPLVLASESRRRRSGLPISRHSPGCFSIGCAGGASWAAVAASSPKLAFRPLAWETVPFSTRTSPAGTAQVSAAAWTSIARAAAPACR